MDFVLSWHEVLVWPIIIYYNYLGHASFCHQHYDCSIVFCSRHRILLMLWGSMHVQTISYIDYAWHWNGAWGMLTLQLVACLDFALIWLQPALYTLLWFHLLVCLWYRLFELYSFMPPSISTLDFVSLRNNLYYTTIATFKSPPTTVAWPFTTITCQKWISTLLVRSLSILSTAAC